MRQQIEPLHCAPVYRACLAEAPGRECGRIRYSLIQGERHRPALCAYRRRSARTAPYLRTSFQRGTDRLARVAVTSGITRSVVGPRHTTGPTRRLSRRQSSWRHSLDAGLPVAWRSRDADRRKRDGNGRCGFRRPVRRVRRRTAAGTRSAHQAATHRSGNVRGRRSPEAHIRIDRLPQSDSGP